MVRELRGQGKKGECLCREERENNVFFFFYELDIDFINVIVKGRID